MTEPSVLTAGHYGYGHRRVHRDDFARVLLPLVPGEYDQRIRPQTEIAQDEVAAAAKTCLHLAARYPREPMGRLAELVAHRLIHTHSPLGPGEHELYTASMLCHEQQALSEREAPLSVSATLEARAAKHVAEVLELSASTELRYIVQTSFDGDFVRSARSMGASRAGVGS